jgi:hypothetical protein
MKKTKRRQRRTKRRTRRRRRKRGGAPFGDFNVGLRVLLTAEGIKYESYTTFDVSDWVGTVIYSNDYPVPEVEVRWDNHDGFIKNEFYSNVNLSGGDFVPIKFIYKQKKRPKSARKKPKKPSKGKSSKKVAKQELPYGHAILGGRRKTRRKRGGRPYRGFKRADIVILTGAGVAHETELGRNNVNDWVGTVTDSYDGGWSVRENPGVPGIARVTVRWENRGGFIKNQNYSNVVLGADYFTNAHPIEFIYKRPRARWPKSARKTTAYQNLGNLHTSKVAKQELDSNLPLGHAILGGRRRKRRRSRRKKRTRRKKMRRK